MDFFDACIKGDIESAEKIMADFAINTQEALKAFLFAIAFGHKPLVAKFIISGIDKKSQEEGLVYAVYMSKPDVAEMLLKNGTNPDCRNEKGETALIRAVINERSDIARMLISKGAGKDVPGRNNITPLMIACSRGNAQLVNLFIECGINATTYDGVTSIMIASMWGHDRIIKNLLENGANKDMADSRGWTALTYAVYEKKPNAAAALDCPNARKDNPVFNFHNAILPPPSAKLAWVSMMKKSVDDFNIAKKMTPYGHLLDLSNADLSGLYLKDAELSECDLSNVDFTNTEIPLYKVLKSRIKGIKIHQAKYEHSESDEEKLAIIQAMWKGPEEWNRTVAGKKLVTLMLCFFTHADLGNADLQNAYFDYSDFSFSNLSGCIFKDTNFPLTMFRQTSFRNAELNRTSFEEAYIDESCFEGAKTEFCNFKKAQIMKSSFAGAQFLRYDLFHEAVVRNCNFENTVLKNASFIHAELSHCSFRGAKFTDCPFNNANLTGSDLRNAEFNDCNFENAILENADFRGATFSNTSFKKIVRAIGSRFDPYHGPSGYIVLCDLPKTTLTMDGRDFELIGGFRGFFNVPPGEHDITIKDYNDTSVSTKINVPAGDAAVMVFIPGENGETWRFDIPEEERVENFRSLATNQAMGNALWEYPEDMAEIFRQKVAVK